MRSPFLFAYLEAPRTWKKLPFMYVATDFILFYVYYVKSRFCRLRQFFVLFFEIQAFLGAPSAIPIVLDFSEVHGCSDVALNQLRKVDMENVSGTKPELEFIKLLLAKSPMLDTMLIKLNSQNVTDELRIVKELTRFRRASPQAEMNFVH